MVSFPGVRRVLFPSLHFAPPVLVVVIVITVVLVALLVVIVMIPTGRVLAAVPHRGVQFFARAARAVLSRAAASLQAVFSQTLQPVQEELPCILVQLNVQAVRGDHLGLRLLGDFHVLRVRRVVLNEIIHKLQVERLLEHELGVLLELCEAEEGHVGQVVFGTLQHDLGARGLGDG